jgi:hypothetical protein
MPQPIIYQADSGLIEGINQASGAISKALQQRLETTKQKEGASILQQALADVGENPSPLQLQSAMNKAISMGASPELVNNAGTLYSTLQRSQPKSPLNITKPGELSGILQQFGVEQELADKYDALYPKLTTGGQTAFANILFDQIQRAGGLTTESDAGQNPIPSQPLVAEESVTAVEEPPFKWPEVDPYVGLLDKEKVSRGNDLFKANTELFNKAQDDFKNYKMESLAIRQLKNINQSNKLPTGKTKIFNVDHKTGELRIPAAANEETQLFVKNINRFLSNAQKVFGGRVTNFEVGQYKQGLPTLANSPEGRTLILEQMDIENQLNQLDAQAIREVVSKYGTRGIDPAQAQILADQWKAQKEQQLYEKFDRVSLAAQILIEKKKAPPNHVLMEINGQRGYVPNSDIEQAKKVPGARIL